MKNSGINSIFFVYKPTPRRPQPSPSTPKKQHRTILHLSTGAGTDGTIESPTGVADLSLPSNDSACIASPVPSGTTTVSTSPTANELVLQTPKGTGLPDHLAAHIATFVPIAELSSSILPSEIVSTDAIVVPIDFTPSSTTSSKLDPSAAPYAPSAKTSSSNDHPSATPIPATATNDICLY